MLKPYALPPGGTIGLVTPSSSIAPFPRRFARARAALEALGYSTVLAPSALWSEPVPSPATLADDIHWCLDHPAVDAVMCTTGGDQARRILGKIDFGLVRTARKIICGFSDSTALTVAAHARTGLITFNGPTLLPSFGDADGVHEYTSRSFVSCVSGFSAGQELRPPEWTSSDMPTWETQDDRPRRFEPARRWRSLRPGRAHGRLVGGHLGTLCALAGTGYIFSAADRVVFLETNARAEIASAELDVLEAAGVLDGARALVFGRLTSPDEHETLSRALTELATRHSLPLVADVDLGHTVPMLTLPLGLNVSLDADLCELRILEDPVERRQEGA